MFNPSRDDAKQGIVSKPNVAINDNKNEDLSFDEELKKGSKESIELEGRRQYFFLQKIWSTVIIFWISILICEDLVILVLTGKGVFNFKNYQWFIMSVSVETFLQIVGMGYVAVRFLFPNKSENTK